MLLRRTFSPPAHRAERQGVPGRNARRERESHGAACHSSGRASDVSDIAYYFLLSRWLGLPHPCRFVRNQSPAQMCLSLHKRSSPPLPLPLGPILACLLFTPAPISPAVSSFVPTRSSLQDEGLPPFLASLLPHYLALKWTFLVICSVLWIFLSLLFRCIYS